MAVNAPRDIALVVPVFDDWESTARLLAEIDRQENLSDIKLHAVVVDDASLLPCPPDFARRIWRRFVSIEVVRLAANLGHQRAIAVGLVLVERDAPVEAVVVMDGDGEDRPEDLARLIAEAAAAPDAIICARRAQRSEGPIFRTLYYLYKLTFWLLTGIRIDFGNFCLIPRPALESLVRTSAIWNHLAAALVRSRLPLRRLSTNRGARYFGRSRMSLIALVVHGLSAISVFIDVVLVRIILGALALCLMTGLALAVVTGLRIFTVLAIPGWASVLGGVLVVIMLQTLMLSAVPAFQFLASRDSKPMVPAVDAPQFVKSRERLTPGAARDVAS
jgi:hypothetical protein